MRHSHINIYWKDIDEKLMADIDRYFDIRFGEVPDDEKAPLRSNEKGALQGYLQTFNDKNGKWHERVKNICIEISKKYNENGLNVPSELTRLCDSIDESTCIEERIKTPLKALYRLSYLNLLSNNNSIGTYDENGNLERINLPSEQLKMAINIFALAATMANRVAHSTLNLEEAGNNYDYKHQMISYLIMAVYDYNKIARQKVDCKFAKLPSKSDGHSYPAFTVKVEDIGKISLHFGGMLRNT